MIVPRPLTAVSLAFAASWIASGQTYTISTFAGGGPPANIAGTSASLYGPHSVAVDKTGNIFFPDGNSVLRLDAISGALALLAGTGVPGVIGDDGLATSARLNNLQGLAVDSDGNLYIADTYNNRVRKVSNGVITTVAGNGIPGFGGDNSLATRASLYGPSGVAVDSAGNLYIADSYNVRIRKVSNGVITTVAGGGASLGDNGPAASAQVAPVGIAVDSADNLYIADAGYRVRKVTNGVITTVAGNGTPGFSGDSGSATSAQLDDPTGVAVDPVGDLYIADVGYVQDTTNAYSRIRKVSKGVITTVADGGSLMAGDNGPATSALLSEPHGMERARRANQSGPHSLATRGARQSADYRTVHARKPVDLPDSQFQERDRL
jgi:hypothetical protein